MTRATFLLIISLAQGFSCTNHYHYGDSDSQGAGPSTTDAEPDESDTAPPPTGSSTGEGPTTGDAEADTVATGDTASTGSMMVPPMAQCGNGIVEGEEACDLGYDANKDTLACTATCQRARCGDGIVQTVVGEACDDGAENVANPGYNQCSVQCFRGAHCGDGVLQPEAGEECEPSQNPGEMSHCPAMCQHAPRLVFLTSETFTGDLDGLAGADQRCNELAAASLLDGSFRAWLLVDGQTLAARFPEFYGAPTAWNFTSMGNELLAKSFEQLVSQGPAGPLAYTELGEVAAGHFVWTNITAAGLAAGGDCSQWTGETGTALIGHSGFVPDEGPEALAWHQQRLWTDRKGSKKPCYNSHNLYCIQVSD